jgi:hypothetical protein
MAAPAALPFRADVIETAGRRRSVNSVREAAAQLLAWPPGKRGDAWHTACETCQAALAGTLEPDTARKAFLKAALVAGIFARGE